MPETYTIPCCSELWTEQMTADYNAGIAIPERDLSYIRTDYTVREEFNMEKSLSDLKARYAEAFNNTPMLKQSRYLDTLNGKVL